MTCRRLFVVIVAAMAVAACTDSGTSGSPTTAPDPTPTSAPMTTMASTTTIAVPTSTSTTTTLPRPSLALRLDAANAPTAGAVASPPWWLVADTGLGLQVARTTGGSTTIVFGEVRVAFTVDARRVVFQRAGDAAGVACCTTW